MADTVFMTAKQVRDFIHSYSLSRRQLNKSSSILQQLIKDLTDEIHDYENIEKEAYKFFGVNDLQSLQVLVDEVNNSQLMYFSNEYINASGTALARNLGSDVVTNILRGMESYLISDDILKPILNELTDETFDMVANNLVIKLAERINENQKDIRRRGIDIKSTKRGLRPSVATLLKFIQDPQTSEALTLTDAYRKHFQLLLNNSQVYETGSTWELKYNNNNVVNKVTNVVPLSYYPYYQLTPEQEKIAENLSDENGVKVWNNFVDHLITVAGMQNEPRARQVLDQLGPRPFIKRELNGVKGILGEVQMLFIAIKLTKGKNVNLIAAGPLRNKLSKNNAELGTDVLLTDTLGVQVKNYSIHNSVYQLSKTGLTWKYLQEQLDDNLTSIGKFYAVYSYNLPTKKRKYKTTAFSEYQDFYINALKQKTSSYHVATQAFFAANIDKFLTFDEAYELIYGGTDGEITKNGSYHNAFYFFGGKTLVPVSYILRLLKYRIQKLLDELYNRDLEALSTFSLTSSYSGPVWPDPESAWRAQSIPLVSTKGFHLPIMSSYTVDEVLSGMHFNIRLNLKLEDLGLETGGPIKFDFL